MFFRLKKTKSGQVLKLIESYRDEHSTPRHRTVASLGNAPINGSDWKPVACAVEERLYGQEPLIPRELSAEQCKWTDHIVRKVLSEGKWSEQKPATPPETVIDGVLADKVSHTETAELGTVLVGWRSWQKLGMPELLGSLGFNPAQSEAAVVSVLNRLIDPVSEHGLLDWFRRTGLPELLEERLRGTGDDRFYRVSDKLLENHLAIEAHLRGRQGELFNLQRTVLLYDLTNTHFEGVCAANPKAKRGKNKQKRNDCPQVVVGMLFDQFGFELAHKVFEGSMHDSKSLIEMIEQFQLVESPCEKPIVVVDGGIASRDNLELLRAHGFRYLVNDSRRERVKYHEYFQQDEAFEVVEQRDGRSPVAVRVMNDPLAEEDHGERVILCRSEARGEKEKAILCNAERRFLDDLEKLKKRVGEGRLKDPEKIQRAIGRLQRKHSRVQRYYPVSYSPDAESDPISWQRDDQRMDPASELTGCYVLRTDERQLDAQQLWQLYICLCRAEAGFRAIKSDLGLRPNRHHKELRVDAHIFICILAYHLLRNILYTLEQAGDFRSWETIKRILRTHAYTTIILPTKNGKIHRMRRSGRPDETQKAIYQTLGIFWQALPSHTSVSTL